LPDYAFVNGDAAKAVAGTPCHTAGALHIGGQEHFYLEGQIAMAVPGEDGAVLVYSSTQHPSEVQHIVARVLALPDSFVTCRVRRMGGGFGGKETQATQWAVIAALAARTTGRPCKFRLDRDADMVMTGKRHDFAAEYAVATNPTAASAPSTSRSTRAADVRSISASAWSIALCSTPTTPISCPNSKS